MVEWPWWWNHGAGIDAEKILRIFFEKHNLTPMWTNCNGVWGRLNKTTGRFTGAIGEVRSILFFDIKVPCIYPRWLKIEQT